MEKIPLNSEVNENNIDLAYKKINKKYPEDTVDNHEEYSNYQMIHKNYNLSKFENNNSQMNKQPILIQVKKDSFSNTSQQKSKKNIIQFNNIKIIRNNIDNSGPKDNLSKKKFLSLRNLENRQKYYTYIDEKKYKKQIPKFISFQKDSTEDKENINSNITKININKENLSELIEIPRSEYGQYAGKDIIFMGEGMETGEYKFKGSKIIVKENSNQNENIVINEEEIYKEIMKRKNKTKKPKRMRYVIVDRFYATTEFDGQPVKQIEKEEQKKMEYEYEMENKINNIHNLNIFFKNKNRNRSFGCKNKGPQIPIDTQELKKIRIHNYSSSKNYGENFRYQNNDVIFPIDYYSKYLFDQINKIRCNPQSYIYYIEKAKENIIKDITGRLIYNGKIKIALNEGESAFNKAIDFLKNMKPMNNLEFNQLITIQCPQNEYDIKDINYMRYKVENMIKNGLFIKSYWREIINDPEISFLLMIIDDVGAKSGMRRNDILNPNMKYIGISSKEINGNFACYITLSE